MTQNLVPFLTFNGNAKEVMDFYSTAFPNAKITNSVPYGDSPMTTSPEEKKYILNGEMEIMGTKIMFMDMVGVPSAAAPEPNWSSSIYIECADEPEFDGIFVNLGQDGNIMMGPEPVGDLRKVAWITDKYGITWQPVWA